MLAGIEGELRVQIAPGTIISEELLLGLGRALELLEDDVKRSVWGRPIASPADAAPLLTADPSIKSVSLSSACPSCEHIEQREWRPRQDHLHTTCRQCAAQLTLPLAAAPSAPAATPQASPALEPALETPPETPPTTRAPGSWRVTAAVSLILLIAIIATLWR